MAEVGSAFVSILPSARGFGSKLNAEVGGELDSAGKSSGKRFGAALKVGALGVIGGAVMLGGFLKGAFEEAREAQKVGALTVSTIKATGGAANVTAKQVGNLSAAISQKTGIDDETIQSGANMLLTFKNIRNEAGKGNDIFSQTTQTLTDMSAAMGSEPRQAAIQLGKALNDPVKGVSALSRVGVTFTEQQKAQISTLVEAGNVMGAQKIVLRELNSEFGGAAAAQATAGDKFAVAWGNFKESVGTALLPLLDRLLVAGTRFVTFLTNDISPGIAALNGYLAPAIAAVRNFFASLSGGGAGAGRLAAAFEPIKTAALGVVNAFRGLYAAVAPIIMQVVAVIRQNWGGIAGFVQQHFGRIRDIIVTVMQIVAQVIRLAAAAIRIVWDKFGDDILKVATTVFRTLGNVIEGAMKVIQGIVKTVLAVLKGDWAGAWDGIKEIVRGATQIIKSVVDGALSVLATIARAALREFLAAIRGGFESGVAAARQFPGDVKAALGAVGSLLYSAGRDLILGLVNGIRAMASSVASAARDVVSNAISAAKSALKIGSPSKVFDEIGRWTMEGLQRGIEKGGKKAVAALKAAIDKAKEKGQELKSVAQSFSESVATSLETGDLFGAGVAGLQATLAQRGANASAMSAALGTAAAKGLDGGLFGEIAASGDVATAQELAAMSAAEIDALEQLYNAQATAIQRVADSATDEMFGQQIADQNKLIRDLQDMLKKLPKAVKDGAEEGTHNGNADKDKQTNQRVRAGR